MQLGQAEALGVFDDHDRGVGHVDAHLNDRGGHQYVPVSPARKRSRHRVLFGASSCGRAPARPAGPGSCCLRKLRRTPARRGRPPRPRILPPAGRPHSTAAPCVNLFAQKAVHALALGSRARCGCATGVRPGGSSSTMEMSRSPIENQRKRAREWAWPT